jgi:hypothetical protein
MISALLFYSLYPTLVALLCLLLLHKAYRSGAGLPYLKLFLNLALMNFCQALGYVILVFSNTYAQYMADFYLICAYFLFSHFIQLALYLSEKDRGYWPKFLYIPPIILTSFHLSGFMVDSYYLQNNAMLHNDGIFAWAFDAFLIVASVTTITVLFINIRQIKSNYLLASKNIIALISFFPFILSASIIIILSNTEVAIPVVIIVPSISLYIVSIFYYISRSQVIDLTIGPKAFIKRLKIASLLLSTLRTKKDLDNFNRQLQLLKYTEAMEKHRNNYNAAADELKVHPTTLRNALKNS